LRYLLKVVGRRSTSIIIDKTPSIATVLFRFIDLFLKGALSCRLPSLRVVTRGTDTAGFSGHFAKLCVHLLYALVKNAIQIADKYARQISSGYYIMKKRCTLG